MENGLLPDGPTEDNVCRVSNALSFPESFFYLDDGLSGLPLSLHPMNRKRASVGANALKRVYAELNIRLIHLRRYLRSVELEPTLPLPQIDPEDGNGPLQIAQIVRQAWSIPEGPINNLTHYCEQAGIFVIWCDLDSGIDGVTMKVRDLPPCIFLNRSSPPDRMRASLAHELGHVIMHNIPTDEMEDEANAFAAELMVPARQFKRHITGRNGISLEFLAQQKAYWKMSMAFILYRASSLDLITRHQAEYAWKRMSALGWRKREPEDTDFAFELPKAFPDLVRIHGEVLGYDIETIGKLLSFNSGDVRKMYQPHLTQKRLYVVK